MGKTNILVVEDESIVALDIKIRLQNIGYTVSALAATGEEAIQAAQIHRPDIVLMDIKLQGKMDGVSAAEQIRAQFDIPVIYLTAFADEVTLQRAKITESFGYLLKPFEERELAAIIETAVYKHRIERRLKENEQWLSTTLNSIGDAVIATGPDGTIKFLNPVAEQLTGWTQAEALDKPSVEVFVILNEESLEPLANPVEQVLHSQQRLAINRHTLLVARDRRQLPIEASAAPIKDEKGATNGVVLIFKDTTEQRAAEAKLRDYTAQLRAHIEELDAFAHTVAHDLQSPLGHMVSMADAVKTYHRSMSPEELASYLDLIVLNGLKTSNIIDALLLLAGVRKKGNVIMHPLDMHTIVREARGRLEHLITANKASISVPAVWPVALGYAPWVEEVWVNYLSNGIKYGGQPPRLQLGAETLPDGQIKFWVQDNGEGILPENQSGLFTPFTQLSQAQTGGHGLGLSIVRRIVEKLNGSVGVESPLSDGTGSLFYFTLPAAGQPQ